MFNCIIIFVGLCFHFDGRFDASGNKRMEFLIWHSFIYLRVHEKIWQFSNKNVHIHKSGDNDNHRGDGSIGAIKAYFYQPGLFFLLNRLSRFVFTCPVAFVKENCAKNKTNKQQKIISILNHSVNRFIADKKIFLSKKAGQ